MSIETDTGVLRISKDSIRDLVKSVIAVTKPQPVDGDASAGDGSQEDGQASSQASPMRACYLDDIIVVFIDASGKNQLYGVTIAVLGREFQVLPDGQVAISDAGIDADDTVYVVEDEHIVSFLEDFIKLRTSLLREFGA